MAEILAKEEHGSKYLVNYDYLYGFSNEHQSECVPGALPLVQTNPQKVPLGLYAEQISGSAFVSEGRALLRSWVYRQQPSVQAPDFQNHASIKAWQTPGTATGNMFVDHPQTLRWSQMPADSKADFKAGAEWQSSVTTICGNGSARSRRGAAIHLAQIGGASSNSFKNADAEMVLLPFEGSLNVQTEMGGLSISVGEIAVIPRGIVFSFASGSSAKVYICENFGHPFRLPDRGLIGANGLASPRHFAYPQAQCFDDAPGELITKYQGGFYSQKLGRSPLDVVAWFGNYAPYKYDLRLFNTMGSISFDHPDPSIFTVLSSPSGVRGEPDLDFVIFPPRWLVGEETFRPPYFHRNVMSEYMGLLYGTYDAKPGSQKDQGGGFEPGGGSLHNCMSAHGPELSAYSEAVSSELKPQKLSDTMAFMFESRHPWQITQAAMQVPWRQKNYTQCWQGFPAAKTHQSSHGKGAK